MKNMNKSLTRLLALVLCAAMMLCACGGEGDGNTTTASAETTYRVTVTDALGHPYTSGVIVRFMQDGAQTAMQVVNEQGVAEKTLATGEYTVELMFTGDVAAYYYDQSDLTLNGTKTELEIHLAMTPASEAHMLYAQDKEQKAYSVSEGCTYVSLNQGERTYFLFTPSVAGTYEFSVLEAVEDIGYYGSVYFVQDEKLVECENNRFTVSVSAGMIGTNGTGTTVMVLGIDGGAAENCTLTIERIGDPEWTVADEPWTVYQPTVKLNQFTLDKNLTVHEFDLMASTDTYKLVLNEADGFYHLDSADGPLVLVRLGKNTKYLDCFKTILENSGVVKYFFDEKGEFIRKENYNDCLLAYIACMDEDSGTYPLTEDLKYIIQQRGEYSGWFDPEQPLYLFKQQANEDWIPIEGINNEISWLFMCCYVTND